MIRSIIITGIITNVAIFGYAAIRGERAPPPPPVRESYLAKDLSYVDRWLPAKDLWAFERSDKLLPGERLLGPPIAVKTERIASPMDPPPEPVASKPIVRKASHDICAKHGMRKQMTSKYKWRCVK